MSRVSRRVSVWMDASGHVSVIRTIRVTSGGAPRVVLRAVAGACDQPVGSPETDSWPALTWRMGTTPLMRYHIRVVSGSPILGCSQAVLERLLDDLGTASREEMAFG